MRVWPKTPRVRKITAALLFLILLTFLWVIYIEIFDKPSALSLTRILVLDDADENFRALQPKDCVYAFPKGKRVRKIADLNICQTVGGCRSLASAPNGEFFVVCENVA